MIGIPSIVEALVEVGDLVKIYRRLVRMDSHQLPECTVADLRNPTVEEHLHLAIWDLLIVGIIVVTLDQYQYLVVEVETIVKAEMEEVEDETIETVQPVEMDHWIIMGHRKEITMVINVGMVHFLDHLRGVTGIGMVEIPGDGMDQLTMGQRDVI